MTSELSNPKRAAFKQTPSFRPAVIADEEAGAMGLLSSNIMSNVNVRKKVDVIEEDEGTNSIASKRQAKVLDAESVMGQIRLKDRQDQEKEAESEYGTGSLGVKSEIKSAKMIAQQKLKQAKQASGVDDEDIEEEEFDLDHFQLGDEELEQVFRLFDTDRSDELDQEELLIALRCLGLAGSAQEVSEKVQQHGFSVEEGAGVNRFKALSNSLSNAFEVTADDAQQFLTVVNRFSWDHTDIAQLRTIFQEYDKNKDGEFSIDELGAVLLASTGKSFEGAELEAMMAEADSDGSGTVDFMEFLNLTAQCQYKLGNLGKQNAARLSIGTRQLLAGMGGALQSSGDEDVDVRQLLLSLSCVGTSQQQRQIELRRQTISRARRATTVVEAAAEKLLRCIRKVVAKNVASQTSAKLQDFVLDFCAAEEKDIDTRPYDDAPMSRPDLWRNWRTFHMEPDQQRKWVLPLGKSQWERRLGKLELSEDDQKEKQLSGSMDPEKQQAPRCPNIEGGVEACLPWLWPDCHFGLDEERHIQKEKLWQPGLLERQRMEQPENEGQLLRPKRLGYVGVKRSLSSQASKKPTEFSQTAAKKSFGNLLRCHGPEWDEDEDEEEVVEVEKRTFGAFSGPKFRQPIRPSVHMRASDEEHSSTVLRHFTRKTSTSEVKGPMALHSWPQLIQGGGKADPPPVLGDRWPEPKKGNGLKTPMKKYLSQCEADLRPPSLSKMTHLIGTDMVCLSQQNLNSQDVADVFILLDGGPPVKKIDLSGNRIGASVVTTLVHRIPLQSLSFLDLSNNPGLGSGALELLTTELPDACPKLESLGLAGIPIADRLWHGTLETMITRLHRLEKLGLAGTGLGLVQQSACSVAAETLCSHGRLTEIDLSRNSFQEEGFRALGNALADATTLRSLRIAENSQQRNIKTVKERLAENSSKSGSEEPLLQEIRGRGPKGIDHKLLRPIEGNYPKYEPYCAKGDSEEALLILLELLPLNASLTHIDLSENHIKYGAAFMLEESVSVHKKFQQLELRENPLGIKGVECLLRLVCRGHNLSLVDFSGFRDCGVQEHLFSPSDPKGSYKLNMKKPLHRVTFRRLMKWCEDQSISMEENTSKLKINGKASPVSELFKRLSKGNLGWEMAGEPIVEFEFNGSLVIPEDGGSNTDVLNRSIRQRLLPLTLKRFVLIANIWKRLQTDRQFETILQAMSKTLLLKIMNLNFLLARMNPHLAESAVSLLVPNCEQGASENNPLTPQDLVPVKALKALTRKHTQRLMFFNAENPSGHHVARLAVPCDRELARRLLVINEWERRLAIDKKIGDVSQHGDWSNIRNPSIDGHEVRNLKDLPPLTSGTANETIISMDYASPFRVRTAKCSDRVINRIVRLSAVSSATESAKVRCLRNISDKLALTPPQFESIIRLFPLPAVQSGKGEQRADRIIEMAENEEIESRCEAFTVFFCQCSDRQAVCSPALLYKRALFTTRDCQSLWQRFGRLQCFDMINVCQLRRSNCGNLYEFDLTRHDHRLLANILINLAITEEGESLHDTRWTGAHWLKEFDYRFVIGATWVELENMPRNGMLSMRFNCQKKEYERTEDRMKMAIQHFNWGTYVFHPKAPAPAFAEWVDKTTDLFSKQKGIDKDKDSRRRAVQV